MELWELAGYIIPFVIVFVISLASAYMTKYGGFNFSVFLASFGIGLMILIWAGTLPFWCYLFPAFIIGVILIRR